LITVCSQSAFPARSGRGDRPGAPPTFPLPATVTVTADAHAARSVDAVTDTGRTATVITRKPRSTPSLTISAYGVADDDA
jgi:hypothetical protein